MLALMPVLRTMIDQCYFRAPPLQILFAKNTKAEFFNRGLERVVQDLVARKVRI